ncbi:PhzF family phenazine biosynthesis protein [Microbacterium halophytorum]|uniref:PhzF family phenazine biosynthesis protein n=1 Tax=Microbacterium halophytorum TaxID=2067568 RepID=UPI000CFA9E79|nr:PhzF family phenazine biosynthesis isomerase [Microbacterium halophytorum]
MSPEILHSTAFALTPEGGNPAGIVFDASHLTDAEMLAIAARLGYPESVFVTDMSVPQSVEGAAEVAVRYFSPAAEVPFCGHATVAAAVAIAKRSGHRRLRFATTAGPVEIVTGIDELGVVTASFTSVEPSVREIDAGAYADLLDVLGLVASDIAEGFPALEAFAGNRHPVLVLADRELFHQFRFAPRVLAPLMRRAGWEGTVTVLSRLDEDEFEARNLFPVGRISEDPATGSAAAATGAYLRAIGRVPQGGRVRIRQGAHVGRPSLLVADIPETGGITVTGSATEFVPAK